MNTTLLGALGAISLVTTALAQGAANAPCFVSQLGTPLGMSDDMVVQNNALGFAFPIPGGGSVTSIDISSNGFVWLGSNSNSACCFGDPSTFVTDTPRIAAMWTDLYPPGNGDVYFNTFPATPSSPASAVITWNDVPEIGTSNLQTIQMQLFDDGSFTLAYDSRCMNTFHDALVGVTEGVAATPNVVDFASITAVNPYVSTNNPTIFEVHQSSWDLAGKVFSFTPLGPTGYLVTDRPQCAFAQVRAFGNGCPNPPTAYEFFQQPNQIDLSNTAVEFTPLAGGGYIGVPTTGFFTGHTNSFPFFDDHVQGPFNLGFTFPYPGGTTTAIDIASNGFIWMQAGVSTDSRCCYGDPSRLLTDPASICALWMDLYPPGGGNIYFDTVGGTEAHITWLNVPEYFSGPAQTAQITLRSNGTFRLSWGAVSNTSHDLLVGISQGAPSADPGSTDFSTGPVLVGVAGGNPLRLAAQTGSRPALGTTFTMELDQISSGSLLGVMVLGLSSFTPPVDLTSIGMPGCSLHVSLDALLSFPLAGPPAPFALGIPNNPSLVSAVLYAQGSTLTPAINPFGFLSSNGLELTVGN